MGSPRLLVWTVPEHRTLVADALATSGAELVGMGSDSPAGAAACSRVLGTKPVGDIRQAIQRDDADIIWMTTAVSIETPLRQLMECRPRRYLLSEPPAGAVADLLSETMPVPQASLTPLMRLSPGYLMAQDALNEFGEITSVHMAFRCGAGEGGLAGRLFDAMDLVDCLCGEPEGIFATLRSPLPGISEPLDHLHGHIGASLRLTDQRCVTLSLSNLAGTWFRGVTILGEGGTLRISDDSMQWLGPDGRVIDSTQADQQLSPGALVGRQIRRMGEHRDALDAPSNDAQLLVLCETARLSCLTGQVECPNSLRSMLYTSVG